jgi:[protein-PII] uridylyltransferase
VLPDNALAAIPAPAPYEYEARLPELPPVTGDAKADLGAARKYLEELHRAGASGHTVVRLQAAAMDRLLADLWERACVTAAMDYAESPVALVALGGYGRRELAPYSDVDLLVLHAHREPDGFTKAASEKLLYTLWDLKLEVGYGVRDLHACEALARQDHTARTALLELRYVAGDRPLYKDLERDQLHGLSQTRVDEFVADKIREMRERREKFGDSLYLLEPNLKQSEGGLRDLQAALWIARARFKISGLSELLTRALLPEREVRDLRRARDFLWRVRNELHYLSRRKVDHLTFDVQPLVAQFLGYEDGDDGTAAEQFMRHYYLAAKTVLVACDAIVDRALEPQTATGWRQVPPPAAMTGAEKGKGPPRQEWTLPGGELKVFRTRLTVTDPAVLRRSPAALVRLFATADRENLELYPYARDLAGAVAAELPAEAARDPEMNQELLACFTRPGTRGRFLWLMHELGALPRLLPEFARVTARRQIDLYHVYPVDVHTLVAVRRLYALRCGDVQEETLSPLMQRVKRPLSLYLGTLFHDIGKGSGQDHSTRGAEIAVNACVRLGLDPADAADVEWLVAKHLRMNAIAQRRDLSDPHLIHAFAEEVGSIDRLEKLYLLTYADVSTVGPRTWTDWKARLLRELYAKTRAALEEGAGARPEPGTAEADGRTRVRAAFATRPSASTLGEKLVERFLAAMPARYFITTEPALAPRHLRLLSLGRGLPVAASVRHQQLPGYSELTITAPDRPGLLGLVAGVLAANRIDIQHAEVFSTPPDERAFGWLAGRALDVFEVRGPEEGALDASRWRTARADLRRVLSGEESIDALLERKTRSSALLQKPLPRLATKVVIDNDSAVDHSVVDVFTADRVGLLHAVARTLHELGVTVDLARISTEGHRAADAFYVRTADGGRLEGGRAEQVAAALQEALARG